MDKTLIFEKKGRIGLLTINRPEKMNALSSELTGELKALLIDLAGFLIKVAEDLFIKVERNLLGGDLMDIGGTWNSHFAHKKTISLT